MPKALANPVRLFLDWDFLMGICGRENAINAIKFK
jgi:hypothetical protein